MKRILLLVVAAAALSEMARAQVNSVSLQASGLTCSMCSNAINKALNTLDFIQKVDADIKTYTFEITFKPFSVIDFDLIKRRVENAGFTVCSFSANIHFDNVWVRSNEPVIVQDKTFVFLNSTGQVLNGDRQVKILDRGFVSLKEYKKYSITVSYPHAYHATL